MKKKIYYYQYFWSIAQSRAVKKGYYFGLDCERDTKAAIKKAVNNMFDKGWIKNTEKKKQAEKNMVLLVDTMITFIETETEDHRMRLRERYLRAALAKLCPFYPFC